MENYFTDCAEKLPSAEAEGRLTRCLSLLRHLAPDAAGMLILSSLNLYYFTGTMGSGALWVPLEGAPVLLIRKGLLRARAESSLQTILPYRSYSEFPGLCAEAGSPLPKSGNLAVDMGGITWAQAGLLTSRLKNMGFVSADAAVRRTRAVKSAWELDKMRRGGALHDECLTSELPRRLHEGISEWEIARETLGLYMKRGHCGFIRVTPPGRAVMGSVAAGDSGLHPTSFDGPLGVRGMHPSIPYMGDTRTVWRTGQLLTVDMPFCLEGYVTDKTVMYWLGSGPLPDELKRAWDCCLEIHTRSAEALRPGTLPSELWQGAQEIAARHGFSEQFMGVGPERVRFLGHGIGLEMDEYPAVAARFDEPLEEGMTLALEPKIGLPGFGMAGIEDTFEVTPQGGRCLTGSKFDILRVC